MGQSLEGEAAKLDDDTLERDAWQQRLSQLELRVAIEAILAQQRQAEPLGLGGAVPACLLSRVGGASEGSSTQSSSRFRVPVDPCILNSEAKSPNQGDSTPEQGRKPATESMEVRRDQ